MRFYLILMMMGLMAGVAYAQLPSKVDETSLAISYTELAGARAIGVLAAVPYGNESVKGYTATSFQSAGSQLRGKYHSELGKTIANWDFNLFVDGTFKGYSVSDLGRQSDVGLAIEMPEFDVGDFHATGGIGIFGRNAGRFGSPNALGTLEDNGYDVDALQGLGLESVTPAPTGLSIKAGNSLNALIYLLFSHPSGLSIQVKALPELVGADHAVHQLLITPATSVELADQVNVELGADLGFQTWDGEIEAELATVATIKLSF